MKIFLHPLKTFPLFQPGLVVSLLFALSGTSFAADDRDQARATRLAQLNSNSSELVIKNAAFVSDVDSTPKAATMTNLVRALLRKYPEVNITIVGAEGVSVDNATIRWRERSSLYSNSASARATLTALREASGRKFDVQEFGDGDFLVSTQRAGASGRSIEVFKLGRLIGETIGLPVQKEIARLQNERGMLSANHGPEFPRMKQIAAEIAGLERQTEASEALCYALLDQIRHAVGTTLEDLKSTEPMPEFKLHSGTGLMIVIGGEQGLEVTRKIVAALE
jgi:hypothetical protein